MNTTSGSYQSLGAALAAMLLCSCESKLEEYADGASPEFMAMKEGVAVGFNRRAGVIAFAQDRPKFLPVRTAWPVLHFTGVNADASRIAYTSLLRMKPNASGDAIAVGLGDALGLTLDDLVPSGQLVIEGKDGKPEAISPPGIFVAAAAWHPKDPQLVAYGYAAGEQYAVAVHNLTTGEDRELARGAINPDYVAWSDDGQSVGAYMADASLRLSNTDGEHGGLHTYRWQTFEVTKAKATSTFLGGRSRFATDGPSFELAFEAGSSLKVRDALGDQQATLEYRRNGVLVAETIRLDQIRFRSPKAIAFVNFNGGRMGLWATDGSGPPQELATTSTVSYYVPIPLIQNMPVYFTQVGSGYGGGCFIGGGPLPSHTGTLAYAVDVQIGNNSIQGDRIIASANGTVVNGVSGVTCNGWDDDGCQPKIDGCVGYGNYVIIAHSDGKTTLYAHMESTNYKVSRTGPVARGCWLGDEGYTGSSAGNKYDNANGAMFKCGDHLHFHWQNGNSPGVSVSGAFVDASLSSSSCGLQAPMSGIMSCVL